jgi:hypothetical protein
MDLQVVRVEGSAGIWSQHCADAGSKGEAHPLQWGGEFVEPVPTQSAGGSGD